MRDTNQDRLGVLAGELFRTDGDPDLLELTLDTARPALDLAHGVFLRLAHLLRDELSELLRALLESGLHLRESLATRLDSEGLPGGLGRAGPSDGRRQLGGCGDRDVGEGLAGRGIDVGIGAHGRHYA